MNTKTTLKWLSVTLLLGISVFCYSMLVHNDKTALSPTTIPSNQEPSTPANPQADEKPKDPPTVYNSFPRSASDFFDCKVQNIGGSKSEVLKAVHTIGDNTYLIFDSSSNSYDIKSQNKCVCIAVLNKALDLISLLVLPGTGEESFLASKVIPNGILIASSGEDYSAIYSVDFALNHKGTTTFEAATSAYMYFSEDGIYAFLSHEKSVSANKLSDKLKLISEAEYLLDNTTLVDVFPTFDGFHILVNGKDCYSILNYKTNGIFTGDSKQNGFCIENVYPIQREGSRCYVMLLSNQKSYTLVEYDKNFSKNAEASVGEYDFCTLLPSGENWLVFTKKESKTTAVLYCKHLDKITQQTCSWAIKGVSYFNQKSNVLTMCLHTDDNKLLVLDYENGTLTQVYEFCATESYTNISSSGIIYLTSAVKNDIFENNFGNTDIFAIKNI